VLHRLIPHFQHIAPTWLLLPADFVSTLQAVPFLAHCSTIVPIGRVRWFPETRHTSKDNFGWFRFDTKHHGAIAIHHRGDHSDNAKARIAICQQCSRRYELQRASARFCSPACKQQAYRKRLSVTVSVTPAAIASTATEPPDSGETFRYVRHDAVEQYTAEGWEPLPALHGTHHGVYSVLMRKGVGDR
jgi:hypothetical protein